MAFRRAARAQGGNNSPSRVSSSLNTAPLSLPQPARFDSFHTRRTDFCFGLVALSPRFKPQGTFNSLLRGMWSGAADHGDEDEEERFVASHEELKERYPMLQVESEIERILNGMDSGAEDGAVPLTKENYETLRARCKTLFGSDAITP